MTILFRNWGPLVQYRKGVLHVSDLNPEIRAQWQMSRMEMLGLGLRCIRAALSRT
jgi:hypothetical protein